MRKKIVWWACLCGVLAVADVLGTAVYVYKNPDSFVGRCANVAFAFGTRFNPFLYGYSVVTADVSQLLGGRGAAVAQQEAEDFQAPEEPVAIEDEVLLPVPAGERFIGDDLADDCLRITGGVASTREPPVADCPHCDPALLPVSGVMGGVCGPCCPPATDECTTDNCFTTMFWKTIDDCVAASKAMNDAHWLGYWFSYFSSPSTLEYQGDAETAEPMDPSMSDNYQEDPNASYHHNDCPYPGVCPYSGKTYSEPAEPQKADEETSEPLTAPKKKMKLPPVDDGEESETPRGIPGIDTMEFRSSDRSWDDYGSPFQL